MDRPNTEVLVRVASQSTPQLLEEQRGAVGGAQKQQGVDQRDIDAFVKQIYRKHRARHAIGQPAERLASARSRASVSAQTATDGNPCFVNSAAMNRACAIDTQNPSARMRPGSST